MNTNRYLFFTGKGGVGKTSVACATAINLADQGKRVLLISTDPASNLDDVWETDIGQEPTAIPGIKNLWALDLDPEASARSYREKVVGSYRDAFPDEVIKSIEEQLSGACTVEIATFDLFTRFLTDDSQISAYDHIIFDTAPTGHTLRLLSLPKAWSGFLGANLHGTSCIGPLAGLQENRERYEKTIAALSNSSLTTLVIVTKPEVPSLLEAARASGELSELGLTNQQLVINCLLQTANDDVIATAYRRQQAEALAQIPAALQKLPRQSLPLLAISLIGIDKLRILARYLQQTPPVGNLETKIEHAAPEIDYPESVSVPIGLKPIVDELMHQNRGLVMVMGKGGVGKTTVAAALALALAERGQKVYLSTTDPAAHLNLVLAGADQGIKENLSVSRIDPKTEVAAYRQEVMTATGAGLDEEGQALLMEDLASPCTEEIAVFRAFARNVDQVKDGFVVLDTAPTGHTLLLLDNTLSYHREVERSTGEVPDEVRRLLPRLRDPNLTHVMVVTLAQATPVLEAARLQDDLRRASIEPDWWIMNQAWSGVATSDPVLKNLSLLEGPWINKVVTDLAKRTIRLPWLVKAPKGHDGLAQLV